MKSKAEVLETLRWFARVFVPQVGIDGTQAGQVITGLANALCDAPDKPNPCDLSDGKPQAAPEDPTDDTNPSYWAWLDRRLDRPYLGPLSYGRALPEDYMLPGRHQNPMRYALGPGWRGRKVLITVTDVTNGEPQPKQAPNAREAVWMAQAWEEGWTARDNHGSGGTANNPYHVNYQGLKYPKSWVEEREALFEENAQLRAELAHKKTVTWAPTADLKRDVTEAHQWRREVSERLHVSVEDGWPKLLERIGELQADAEGHRQDRQDELKEERAAHNNWLVWGAGLLGGMPIATKTIFGRVTEEVAALQQTARANELRANEAKERVQYLERLLQERAQREVTRADPWQSAVVRNVQFGISKWASFETTILDRRDSEADRFVVLRFPKECAGQKFRIEVAKTVGD